MYYYNIAPKKIIRSDSESYTYSSSFLLSIGQLVLIEVGKKQMIGIIINKVSKPPYSTKSVQSIIYQTPIPIQLVELARWLSKYYVTPLANVLQTILPNGLQRKRHKQPINQHIIDRQRTNNVFNKEQRDILKLLSNYNDGTFLLQGVTGSGKTEVYIDIAKQELLKNRSSIILVPEIALTSQLISEFSQHFIDNIIVTHSKMTESKRHIIWETALESKLPMVVIGPRSALFTPLKEIGAIIIDEAHEPSYKQEQSPKYSALRAATILGRYHNAKVIFGSATPSVTDRYLAEKSNRPILKLNSIARTNSKSPYISLIDMTKRTNFKSHRFLSDKLIKQITETLQINKQILIFHNRRGSATTTLCENCGWTAECPRCYLPLTLHSDYHHLNCHICGYNTKVPTTCTICNNANIIHKGIGTKLIESELRKLFPKSNIERFDADNTNSETINERYSDIYNGNINIIIGTQIVAKGLDLPNLRTVGVIQADTGLTIPDFNTSERTFQLLTQVIGRVGRNEHQTQVIIQTYQPTHPSIKFGLNQDYESFYIQTLNERKKSLFPPYIYLLKLTCSYKTELTAIKNTRNLARILKSHINDNVQILGPTPAFYERQNEKYHWQLILKSPKREYLTDALKLIPPKHWQSELDPTSLL